MNYRDGVAIFQQMEKSGNDLDKYWKQLYLSVLECAVDYAQVRARWLFLTPVERSEADRRRTIQHDAFISSLNVLARYATKNDYATDWVKVLECDRKEIGDFACYIACIIGLESR
ncbi:hypothetical protein [Caproiciproducens sp. LBM24188]|nr:hypothetical protein [Oscillospiraceae bacterium]